MKITISIPDGKVDDLVRLYNQKYQLPKPKTAAEAKDFLEKIVQHEQITILRTVIAIQKEAEAKQAISADADIAESAIEADLKAKQAAQQAAMQADMQRVGENVAPE
jgi:hypothetical protein